MNNMQKSSNNQEFERKLKEELDWYTLYASEEEYDEKAVESILYLLDRWDPLEEDVIPSEKEAWLYYRKANRCIAVSGSCIVISLPLAA